MTCYRVSKYDPTYRANGIYQKDEWTAISDIGRVYADKMFTEDDYLAVEQSYIDFVLCVCNLQKINIVTVKNLENHNNLAWKNGQKLNLQESVAFIKSCLREQCWGRLVSKKFVFETGYDYYMLIQSNLSLDTMEQLAHQCHLFVEEWK